MAKLSDKIKETIAEVRPGIIATASRDGKPNVSAKGSLRVLDDDHVVFATYHRQLEGESSGSHPGTSPEEHAGLPDMGQGRGPQLR